MNKAVLLVDENERRRKQVAAELQARDVPVLERANVLDAMASVERAALGAVVLAAADSPMASLRALCQLARRHHPEVRLVVLAPAVVQARTVEASLGLVVDVLDEDGPPGSIAAEVLASMARPMAPAPSLDLPSGSLDEQSAIWLLRHILERRLTGRLEVVVSAASKGTLYFHRGEPVAADHARGDAGMLGELERRGLVPGSLDIGFVPEGELLATLVTAGNVSGEAMHAFVGAFVRARLVELVLRGEGRYRFVEDGRFLESAPLLHVDLRALLEEWERSGSLRMEREPPPPLDEDARVREEVLSLYMRLKPIRHPRQVLGVPLWADPDAIEAAYQKRLAETDPGRLPPGASRELLASKLEELRVKVVGAMEALRLQQKPSAGPAPRALDDSNPF